VRGIEQRKIFCEDFDWDDFLSGPEAVPGIRPERGWAGQAARVTIPGQPGAGYQHGEALPQAEPAQPSVSQSVDRGEGIAAEKRVTLLSR
jgi:hypothetical protein